MKSTSLVIILTILFSFNNYAFSWSVRESSSSNLAGKIEKHNNEAVLKYWEQAKVIFEIREIREANLPLFEIAVTSIAILQHDSASICKPEVKNAIDDFFKQESLLRQRVQFRLLERGPWDEYADELKTVRQRLNEKAQELQKLFVDTIGTQSPMRYFEYCASTDTQKLSDGEFWTNEMRDRELGEIAYRFSQTHQLLSIFDNSRPSQQVEYCSNVFISGTLLFEYLASLRRQVEWRCAESDKWSIYKVLLYSALHNVEDRSLAIQEMLQRTTGRRDGEGINMWCDKRLERSRNYRENSQ